MARIGFALIVEVLVVGVLARIQVEVAVALVSSAVQEEDEDSEGERGSVHGREASSSDSG
jgi:hypothetical protein